MLDYMPYLDDSDVEELEGMVSVEFADEEPQSWDNHTLPLAEDQIAEQETPYLSLKERSNPFLEQFYDDAYLTPLVKDICNALTKICEEINSANKVKVPDESIEDQLKRLISDSFYDAAQDTFKRMPTPPPLSSDAFKKKY